MSFTFVGRIKPLSVSNALTTPPSDPEILIKAAHSHGFVINFPLIRMITGTKQEHATQFDDGLPNLWLGLCCISIVSSDQKIVSANRNIDSIFTPVRSGIGRASRSSAPIFALAGLCTLAGLSSLRLLFFVRRPALSQDVNRDDQHHDRSAQKREFDHRCPQFCLTVIGPVRGIS